MSIGLSSDPAFLGETAYLPRVTVHDGRALEQALAGPDLWQSGIELRGAVVEASFAQSDPPLLRRLSEARVDYIVDPQTLRFASATFLDVARIEGLPYAPRQAITPASSDAELEVFTRGALRFQHDHGAAALLVPAPPLYDSDFERWVDLHNRKSLKTTIRGRHADVILAQPELRSRFVCTLGCCRFRGFDGFAERRRQHYLWVRHSEVAQLAGEPTKAMRLDRVHRQLVEARDSAAVVTRTLADRQLDRLERWLGVLSRLIEAQDKAA